MPFNSPAWADDRDPEIAELKARLERLEKLLEQREAGKDGPKADNGGPAPGAPPTAAKEPATAGRMDPEPKMPDPTRFAAGGSGGLTQILGCQFQVDF